MSVTPISQADAGKTAHQWAEEHVERYQKTYNVYAVRGGGPEGATVAGAAASKIVADFTAMITGKKMVEYRVFLIHKERRVGLSFETDQERFASLLPVFDQVIASLRLE